MLNQLTYTDGISDNYLQLVKEFIDDWTSDSIEIMVNTSGSTGVPKKIKLSKKAARHSAWSTGLFFDLGKDKTALLNLSPDYIAGKMMIVRAIEHDMNLVVAPLSENPLLQITDEKIDFAAFVPSQIRAILNNPTTKEKLAQIKKIIIGGAPLNPQIENELTVLGCDCYVTFGMTETITHFALRKVGTPIYHCLDGFEIGVDDRSCLVIQPNEIIGETLMTNDVVDLVDAYSFKWKGRIDFVINSGGVKIHPEKVEKMIAHLLPENNYYLTSKSDDKYGEIAILLVEGEVDTKQLLVDAKSFLPKLQSPKEIYLKAAFNYTESGKIIRERF